MPAMAWLSGWGRDVTLTRQFGVLSLVVVGLITTTFCLVISHSLKHDLLDREWSTTADFIRTEAIHNLRASDFAQPGHPAAQERFLLFYQRAIVMPEIVRVKIYDASMRVVWSDEPRLLGQVFRDNPELSAALAGQTKELASANDELRAVQQQLVASERMAAIGEVVAAVAHGIRNPLANIRAAAQIAMLDWRPGAELSHGSRCLTQIIGEVDRLEGRLKDLLRSVRPTERQIMPFDVNSVVRSALRVTAGRIDEAGPGVPRSLGPGLPTNL